MISDFGFRISDFSKERGRRLWGVGVAVGFLLILIVFFWPVVLGGRSLVPFDVLYTDPVWAGEAAEFGVGKPQNGLLADLILENYAWKRFIRESLQARQLPLWNPYLLAGVPFLAAGQHSALYPLSAVYYALPLWRAYGVFTVLQLWLAGLCMYLYLRVVRAGRFGAIIAGLAYMLSGFMIVSVVHPMILAAVSWLPLLLALIEVVVRNEEEHPSAAWLPRGRGLLALLTMAVVVGLQFLAGHVEISYYIVLVTAIYGLWRLAGLWRRRGSRQAFRAAVWLVGLGLTGVALAGLQLIPMYELVTLNFRQGAAGFRQVLSWAYPKRQIIAFLIPDFFGNPAHHQVRDLFSGQWVELAQTTEWGIKNLVEGTAYIGLLPPLLALIAVLFRRGRQELGEPSGVGRRPTPGRVIWFFAGLAGISLLFAFGTPAYALLYYALPGLGQVHTPFRWVFPYTMSMAVLAGLGADWLAGGGWPVVAGRWRTIGWLAMIAGLVVIAGLSTIYLPSHPAIRLAQRVMNASQVATEKFGDPRLFLSYQAYNLGLFGGFLALAGLVIILSRWGWRIGGVPAWQFIAAGVLIADLWAFGHDFYPRVDPKLANPTPPAIGYLQQKAGLYRLASYGPEHVLWPNAGMLYGLSDIRGYDSIIPQQYTEYMDQFTEQNLLLYNRIAPLDRLAALDSTYLDLLSVKYLLSASPIHHPDFQQVYRDGSVRVYEHIDPLPRALLVPKAEVIADPGRLRQALHDIDPRQTILLEKEPSPIQVTDSSNSSFVVGHSSFIHRYTPNQIEITVETPQPQWLLLTDSYFPGWRAFITPAGGTEYEVDVYRADANFRAVRVPAGRSTVRFKYFPLSVKVGLYVSFLAAIVIFLGFTYWLWTRWYREAGEGEIAQRVAKNSLVPMAASLLNKGIDFAFAMLMLRVLGPTDAGKYYLAIVIIGFADIFTNFGLNLLVTREVAKDRSQGNRYLSNTALLRLILWAVSIPLLGLYVLYRQATQPLDRATLTAIGLLAMGLLPSNVSAALSSLFTAYEQMEVPAAIATVTTLLKVGLGALALLLGYGFVGLAGVSVIVNTITAFIFLRLVATRFFRPRLEFDRQFVWRMLVIAAPLMLNHLLQTVFFKIDVVILDQYWPEAVIGWYSTAYKWIDALLIIPAYFTLAVFPLMSRRATSDRAGLVSAYRLSLRLLLMAALPIATATLFIADELILVLGGSQFLPAGAIALRLMIWFLPLSFVNGVTQYVLIAIDQQRWITVSFAVATGFNLVANLLLVPGFGYPAAAIITIVSEVALFLPFYYSIRQHLGPLPLLSMSWRPLVAAGLMAAGMALLHPVSDILALGPAGLVYIAALILLGAFTEEDKALARRLLPRRWQPQISAPSIFPRS